MPDNIPESAEPQVVPPQTVPRARPWPWAGGRTARLRPYFTGERRLMSFFMWVSILMVVAIILVSALTLRGFAPPFMDVAPPPAPTEPHPAPTS